MKKSTALFLATLIAGVAVLCYGHITLSAAHEKVSFILVESIGDATLADGLTVTVSAHLDYHLLWETAHTFGDPPQTNTEFSFHTSKFVSERIYLPEPIGLSNTRYSQYYGGLGIFLDDVENDRLPQELMQSHDMLRDVASRIENGQQYTEVMFFSDYFDIYPIHASIRFDTFVANYYHENGGESLSRLYKEVNEAFTNYLRIPVSKGEQVTVTMRKDFAGNIVELNYIMTAETYLHSRSVETDDGIYLAVSLEVPVDSETSFDGVIICFVPTVLVFDEQGYAYKTLDYHNIQTVYPTKDTETEHKSHTICSIALSDDGSCLNMITFEDGDCYLTIIEIDTMSDVQKLIIFDGIGEAFSCEVNYFEGLLYTSLGDDRFALMERTADNSYRLVLTGTRNYRLSFENGHYLQNTQLAWNGERLALVSSYRRYVPDHGGVYISEASSCGFVLELIDSKGQQYKGAYESSLDVLGRTDDMYYYACRLIDSNTDGLSVSW